MAISVSSTTRFTVGGLAPQCQSCAVDLHHLHLSGGPAPLRWTCANCGDDSHESEEDAALCCFEVVRVTQEFIDYGLRREPSECPIALALASWSNHPWRVAPGTAYDRDRGDVWHLDGAIEDWISEFDDGALVHPIGLVMDTEALSPTIRLLELTEEKNG